MTVQNRYHQYSELWSHEFYGKLLATLADSVHSGMDRNLEPLHPGTNRYAL
ncbi:MAG: hypothetical protein ACLTXL_15480 [Clostridia bacterium]